VQSSQWTSDLHWVREGKQDRSRKTQAKLLDAAEDLFAEHGIDGATMADIAAAAGCSIGAFYHHYRDKRALQFALFDRYATMFEKTNRIALDPARWEGACIADIVQSYVQVSIENDRMRPGQRRAATELGRVEPEIRSHVLKLRAMMDTGIRELLLARSDEIGHSDPELAISFVLDQLGSMIRTRVHEPEMPTRFASQPDEQFFAETVRSVCAYLQVDPPGH